MKYYKRNNEVYAFELDGSQDDCIQDDMVLMTEEEVNLHKNPQHILSDEEKKAIARASMPDLTPIEFDMKLRKAELLQTVRDYVATNEVMEIAYTRATFFRRTDPFIETARIELGLTEDQVDQIWTS